MLHGKDYTVNPLFSVPLYSTVIKNTEGFSSLMDEEITYSRDGVKFISEDTYLLDKEKYKPLKNEIMQHVNSFVSELNSDIELRMTQSWVSVCKPNQYHAMHCHPNSVVSGVLYLGRGSDLEDITFYRGFDTADSPWQFMQKSENASNAFNALQCSISVNVGNLLLFRSNIPHSVNRNNSQHDRCSLAFNTFITGRFGNRENLTEATI